MKLKVQWYDKKLLLDFFSKIGGVISIIEFFKLIDYLKINIFKCFFENISNFYILIAFVFYSILFYLANIVKKLELNIDKVDIEIREGDIFTEKGLKVIPFNEKFDIEVNDKIISENSLNGKFLNRRDLVKNINEFQVELKKEMGEKDKYELGSIFKWNNEYLITAFSKFNDKNQAYLQLEDYYSFLEKFWGNLSAVYSGRNIIIPLLGSGITRLDVEDEELLKMILLTLKLSRKKFNKIIIVLTENKLKKIDLYHVKELIK